MNTQKVTNRWKWFGLILLVGLTAVIVGRIGQSVLSHHQSPGNDPPESIPPEQATVEQTGPGTQAASAAALGEKLGIEISAVQVGVGGTRLNFRYRVIDPVRATQLTNWLNAAYLVDSTGKSLLLPTIPKAAPLRQESGQQLRAGRIYSHFFPNPGCSIKSGDRVTLVIGNLRAENLVVQ